MTVYELHPDSDRFHNFALLEESDSPIYHRFNGTRIGDQWEPLTIMSADTDDELALLGDYALLGTIPLFSERAVSVLSNVLHSNGEVLPVVYPRRRYFAYNVTTVVNALDENLSMIVRFSTGRVMSIERFAFRPEELAERTIFKIPQLPRAYVFVTDAFVTQVRNSGLEGFLFEEVWRQPTER